MSDPICVADIVQLNSGGPDMTVASIDDGKATVELPDDRGPAVFDLDALTFIRRHSIPVGNAAATGEEGGAE